MQCRTAFHLSGKVVTLHLDNSFAKAYFLSSKFPPLDVVFAMNATPNHRALFQVSVLPVSLHGTWSSSMFNVS